MCEDRVGRGKEYAKQQADGVCAKVILSGYEREGEGGEDEIEERERRKHKNLRATRHFRKVARTEGCRVWG